MTFSEYLSRHISWDPPLQTPRLSIPPILRPQSWASGSFKPPVVDDTSTEITAISYPKSPAIGRRAKFRAYIHQISVPFNRRFKPRVGAPVPERTTAKPDTIDVPIVHSRFQLPPSPSFLAGSPISPSSPMSESTAMSQIQVDRGIRVEQDAAYERAQKLDQEFIEKLREKRLQEEERLKRLAEQEEQERIREREEAAYRRAQNDWRRWARRALVPVPQAGNETQFAVRLPCGQRRIGKLPSNASLEAVHVFAETLLIPTSFSPEDDPEAPPEGYEHRWNFRLVTTNSRFVVPNDPDSKIRELEVMKRGVLLIIEEVEEVEDANPRELLEVA
ncbi:hypothetical protein FRC11_004831 [Ceratobasidium sp. 423]|nr:hypothetical protein FRC11_004831 [Ceratobasidium sp. 423]